MDGADAGGSDFEEQDGSKIFGLELGEGALVGPEVGELLGKSDGRNGKQRARDGVGFRWDSCCGEMVAVVIDWAQARQDQRAVGIFCSKSGIAEQGLEIEGLTFYEE